MDHPISTRAIPEQWPQVSQAVLERLTVGASVYGDTSFEAAPSMLAHEIEQEALDIMGWGFILAVRLRALRAQLERLEGAG